MKTGLRILETMNESNDHLKHDNVERLLPWFVNGTLDPEEMNEVSRHVSGCEVCERAIAELSVIRHGVRTHPATPIVPEPNVERLMVTVDAHENRGSIGMPRWAIAASLGALLLAAFNYYWDNDRSAQLPQRYETATSTQDTPGMAYVLAVDFVEGLGATEQDEILKGYGATDITRSGPEAVYRVTARSPAMSVEELARFTDKLAATTGVASVEVVALQSPLGRDP